MTHTEQTSDAASANKHQPPKTPIHHGWITFPLLIAFLGLLGTAITALLQQHASTLLERNKFQYQLIQQALAAPSQHDAGNALLFYTQVGLLSGLAEDKLVAATKGEAVKDLPVFHGAAVRDGLITVKQAKEVLIQLTAQNSVKDPKGTAYYSGPKDNEFDLDFEIGIMRFQKEAHLGVDGLIGPQTVLALWDACPTCPDLLKASAPAPRKN